MNCSNCNAWLPDDASFCGECGHKVEPMPEAPVEQSFCPECGAPLLPDDMFCGNCGTKNSAYGQPAVDDAAQGGKKKGFKVPVKALVIGVAAVAVIAVVLLVTSLFSGGTDSYTVYIKDRELFAAELPKAKDPMQLTDRLVDMDDVDNEELAEAWLDTYITLSKDGKKMFYPDKIDDDGATLYYRDITNSKKEPVKIDSSLEGYYTVNENGNLVTYIKNDNLYQHNLSEKTKIAGDVREYRVSKDGKNLLYVKDYTAEEGGDLYLKKGNGDAEKITSGVTSLVYANDDLSLVMYRKEDSLYHVHNGKEPEKIASDVYSVYAVYDSGACYYSKQEEAEITYWSVVNNDIGSDGEYYKDWLEADVMDNPLKTLYYFDGKESVMITETMIYSEGYTEGDAAELFTYSALESEELPTVKLSETYYGQGSGDIYSMFWAGINGETVYYAATGAKTVELEQEDIRDVVVTQDGTVWVKTDYDSEDYTYSLYKVTVSDGKIKSSDMLDDEVYLMRTVSDSDILYWKDVNDNDEGELYLNGTKVGDDSHYHWATFDEDTGCVYYMVDYDDDKMEGTLVCWDGKKNVTIADDVHDCAYAGDGQILYLYDYSTNNFKGELYSWNGKKAVKLDDDVVDVYVIRNN